MIKYIFIFIFFISCNINKKNVCDLKTIEKKLIGKWKYEEDSTIIYIYGHKLSLRLNETEFVDTFKYDIDCSFNKEYKYPEYILTKWNKTGDTIRYLIEEVTDSTMSLFTKKGHHDNFRKVNH